jgi:hypothetical protein
MSRLLKLVSLLLVSASLAGCGYVAVSGAIFTNPQTVNGLVTVVTFSAVNGMSSITIVALAEQDTVNTIHFCGDQRAQFPMSTMVQAKFSPSTNCDNLISVSWQ